MPWPHPTSKQGYTVTGVRHMRETLKTQTNSWLWFKTPLSGRRRRNQSGESQLAKLTKKTAFKANVPKAETPMEKTTRIVRKIVDDEAEQRQVKNARLRIARLEREANTPAEATADARKTRRSKPDTKR